MAEDEWPKWRRIVGEVASGVVVVVVVVSAREQRYTTNHAVHTVLCAPSGRRESVSKCRCS